MHVQQYVQVMLDIAEVKVYKKQGWRARLLNRDRSIDGWCPALPNAANCKPRSGLDISGDLLTPDQQRHRQI